MIREGLYKIKKFHLKHGRTISAVLLLGFVVCTIGWVKNSSDMNKQLRLQLQEKKQTEERLISAIENLQSARFENVKVKEELNDVKKEDEAVKKKLKVMEIIEEAPGSNSYPLYQKESNSHEDAIEEDGFTDHFVDFHDAVPASELCPGGRPKPELFADPEAYRNSPYWRVPRDPLPNYNGHHWATKEYEQIYRKNPPKVHVPRLNKTISQEAFVQCFMNTGLPVILPFEVLRPMGFTTPKYTLDEMLAAHPIKRKKVKYKANGMFDGTPELGPALLALKVDAKKKKMGVFRNYPRNMKLTRKAVGELGLDFPPYHNPRNKWQLSTMFMGATTADTPMHSDCCDNFCQHIVGTKRWIISPPTETRFLKPNCFGGLCWAKSSLPMHPTLEPESFPPAEQDVLRTAKYELVDVHSGEILYLPAAWFHAVYNLNPTCTLINWVSSGPSQVYVNVTGKTGGQSAGRNKPCLPGMEKCGVGGIVESRTQ
uniref:JmjC domain-containing protein n=1 Tax=Aplanochytrium stocchinoi TaxID=215587 RepID=A0A6S8EP89_9STRA|mmetsp:Transcript_28516/g.34871  ORF Transcript_28516/g.34871 Transcript_28516/m.34871 type:complete len:484 (+) Transcript_28516:130-1581(+)|eukprot:CAMPEP_0204824712 /NCGR_PEP_ID=MMETSP1346-20131115/2704_1 /ASSEMBLY_ACC=CAM_ASM_000771 /TAXON_ID=215587 /ORGANISM="Aplanochytrium stocchinoi, Strain GSBS06" /LENGTH=483 /DNA_ID=CAMNT_0051952015 /DNA_START=68 /DNA_END=1519 /DNA_ORIENTATION=-